MRWDRLFEDLEAQAADLELQERDALIGEIRDGEWADTSWRDLLGGRIAVEVLGVGRIEGVVGLSNQHVIQVTGERQEYVISAQAVAVILSAERRAGPVSVVASRLGWGHVLRALRDTGDEIRIRLIDSTVRDGVVDVVGRDFVRLRTPSGRDQDIVWTAMAVVSCRT